MAFPTVTITTDAWASSADDQTAPVVLPTLADGDLCIISLAIDASETVTVPSWATTTLHNASNAAHTSVTCWRICDGTANDNSGGSADFTWSSNEQWRAIIIKVAAADWDGTNVEGTAGTIAAGTDKNPPSETASWGSDENLFISLMTTDGQNGITLDTWSETDNQTSTGFTLSNGDVGVAVSTWDTSETDVHDPPTYTLSSSRNGWAGTIVVGPASGGTSLSAGANVVASIAAAATLVAGGVSLAAGGQAIGLSEPLAGLKPGIVESVRTFVSSDTTTNTSLEDIDGSSTTITLPVSGEIAAFMSVESSSDTNNSSGWWSISINGTDSPDIERVHGTAGDTGSVGVTYRSGTLSPGTYTVVGRHRVENTHTLTSANVTLVAIAMMDDSGRPLANTYDTVASDTTTSTTLEDIDGLTQSLSIDDSAQVFSMLATSISNNGLNVETEIAAVIGSEVFGTQRTTANTGDAGSACAIGRTASRLSGSQTIKGQHRNASGTLTTAPSIQVAFALAATRANTSETTYEIPSSYASSSADSTTSVSLEDIASLNQSIVLDRTAHVVAFMTLDAVMTADTDCNFAISINGVDHATITRSFTDGDDGAIFVVARTTSALAAGTYDVRGRWSTAIGGGGTLSLASEGRLASLALEVTDTPGAVLSAGPQVLAVTAPTATLVPGAVTLGAGDNAIAIAAPTAELVEQQIIAAGANAIALSASTAALVPGAVSIDAGAQAIALIAPEETLVPGAVTLESGTNAVAVVAPDATLVAEGGPQNISAGANAIAIVSPTVTVVSGAVSVEAGQNAIALVAPETVTTTTVTLEAGSEVIALSAPAAVLVPGAVSVTAGDQAIAVVAPAAEAVVAGVSLAGPQVLAITAPAATAVSGAVSIDAGAQAVALIAPDPTVSLATIRAAGNQAIAIVAPDATLVPGAVTVEAGDQAIAIVAPTASIPTGAVSLDAGAQAVALTAPDVALSLTTSVEANQQAVALVAPAPTVVAGAVSVEAGAQAVAIVAPEASIPLDTTRTVDAAVIAITAPAATVETVIDSQRSVVLDAVPDIRRECDIAVRMLDVLDAALIALSASPSDADLQAAAMSAASEIWEYARRSWPKGKSLRSWYYNLLDEIGITVGWLPPSGPRGQHGIRSPFSSRIERTENDSIIETDPTRRGGAR